MSEASPTESVWDYPRPPATDALRQHVVIEFGGAVIADTRDAIRVLETSHPPVYYLPPADIAPGALSPSARRSWCEFKGEASYDDVIGQDGTVARDAAWHYPEPTAGFEQLRGHVAFYPGRMTRCVVDGEQVRAQEGDFYGGWITDRITGPFKGAPGTLGW